MRPLPARSRCNRMSNGAHAATTSVGRAIAFSPSRTAMNGATDTDIMGLLIDEPLEAAQLSHSQIIERQADTIAHLERQVERGKEYKTLTKVKLKEAAQRLREYRERVESLMTEVAGAKKEIDKLNGEKKKALAQVQATKKQQATAEANAAKALQEAQDRVRELTKAKPSRTIAIQTDAVAVVEPLKSTPLLVPALQPSSIAVGSKRSSEDASLVATDLDLKKTKVAHTKMDSVRTKSIGSRTMDAIAAAVEAELDFSDDDGDEGAYVRGQIDTQTIHATVANGTAPVKPDIQSIALDDAISQAIDDELDFGSSSDSESSSSDDSSDEETVGNTVEAPAKAVDMDLIGAAIDAELDSSSEDSDDDEFEGVQAIGSEQPATIFAIDPVGSGVQATTTSPPPVQAHISPGGHQVGLLSTTVDEIDAAIDADLASSDDDEAEDGDPLPTAATAVHASKLDGFDVATPSPSQPSTLSQKAESQSTDKSTAPSSRDSSCQKLTVRNASDIKALPPVQNPHVKVFAVLKAALIEPTAAMDSAYLARTLGVFIKQVSFLLRSSTSTREPIDVTAIPGVNKLCQMVADTYRQRNVDAQLLMEGIVRVYHTPRTRHQVDHSVFVLAALFQRVLFRFFRRSLDQAEDGDEPQRVAVDIVPEIHDCLHKLRDLVVAHRLTNPVSNADVPKSATRALAFTSESAAPSVNHDKVFLAHVCGLHSALCAHIVSGNELSRVFLVDVLKLYANIKGLHCIRAMVHMNPRVLVKEWTSQGNEVVSATRDVMIHELLAITTASTEKHEHVLEETAAMMLAAIARYIDEPSLAFSLAQDHAAFARTLWRDHIEPCFRVKTCMAQVEDVVIALELVAAIHGDEHMAQHFQQSHFTSNWMVMGGDMEDGMIGSVDPSRVQHQREVILRFVCAIGRGVLRSKGLSDGSTPSVVAGALQWLAQIRGDSDVDASLWSKIIEVTLELLVGVSESHRKNFLCDLLRMLPRDRLQQLSPHALRLLRLLTSAARPIS